MTGGGGRSSRSHIAGLALAAITTFCLVALWVHGPVLVRGTLLEDVFTIVYVVLAAAVLAIAEKVANRLIGR